MITLPHARVQELLTRFDGKSVVVVGDVMLDEYLRGEVTRISPEAPVPVVELRERTLWPGGAANAAANVVALGGRARLLGVVGKDTAAASLSDALEAQGIGAGDLVRTEERPTTHKLRIVARAQQIVRVDVEERGAMPPAVEAALVLAIEQLAADAQAIVVSDYDKGVVSAEVVRAAVRVAKARGIVSVADPKGKDFRKYAGIDLLTPNLLELETVTGVDTGNEDARVLEAGNMLLQTLEGGTSLLVTRGASGMTLLRREHPPLHVPTAARSVFDVTGAGDSVVGALTLALASRIDMADALLLATHAASVAVSRAGTVAVTRAELLDTFGA